MTSYIICRKRLGIKKSDIELLKKSVEDRKLEHFKSELLKILDKKEKEEEGEEVSKAFIVQELYKSMTDPLYMAKGGKVGAVGEIRTWNGKKYKKMPNKKWVRVYDTHDRHTEISIARLKGRVRKAQSVDELFEIVMNNTHRFSDENGKPLDIVLELKKEVDARKKTLNAGKPSKKTPDTGKEKNYYATRNGVTTEEERKKQLKAASEEDKELINRLKTSDERKDILRIYVSKVASGDMETKRDKLHALCKDNVLNDIMDSIGKGYEPVENKKRNNHSDYFFRIKNENGTFSDGGAIDKNIFEFAKFMWQNRGNKTVKNAINGGGNGGGGDGGDEPPKENVKIDIKDFPEQFNKGKWKKQTKILMDFMNGTSGDSTVKSLYKKLGAMINNLPFKIAKTKQFANGQFSVSCDRRTMKPVEQTLHLLDISDENENIRRDTCMKALHEIMHMVDFSCRENKDNPEYASVPNTEITNAIENAKISDEEIKELGEHFAAFRAKEKEAILRINEKVREVKELQEQYNRGTITKFDEYAKKYKEVKSQYDNIEKEIKELRAKEADTVIYSDILDAISGGELHDKKSFGGHGKAYYRNKGNRNAETVANYAALLASGSEYADRLKKKHPELAESVYNLYKKMLER